MPQDRGRRRGHLVKLSRLASRDSAASDTPKTRTNPRYAVLAAPVISGVPNGRTGRGIEYASMPAIVVAEQAQVIARLERWHHHRGLCGSDRTTRVAVWKPGLFGIVGMERTASACLLVLNHRENRGQNDQRPEGGADEAADNRAGSPRLPRPRRRQPPSRRELKLAGPDFTPGRRGLLSRGKRFRTCNEHQPSEQCCCWRNREHRGREEWRWLGRR
jgi:hypothetical protein